MLRVLVVDDDSTLRMTVRLALESKEYRVDEAEDGAMAVDMALKQGPYDAVLLDVNMPKLNGIEALTQIKQMNPATFCLMLTAYTDVKDAVNAIKLGAFDYLEKPVDADRILQIMESAKQANSLVEAAAFSAPRLAAMETDDGRNMIGGSSSIRKVFDLIFKLSKVDTSVLIRGESGTGKELVARAIHSHSHRKKGPFVAVNCAAIPENLIESELFGHEKGAFTGADRRKVGKFQFAEGGTLFLDEIGDISPQMQVKLLRVLQERRFTPVGSNSEIPTDLRIIAATNRPLEQMISAGTFRADLFYRLNVLPITLPPLRDRREDLPPLIEFMIRKFNKLHNRSIKGMDFRSLNALRMYNWPGNIRELENVIEHAFILETSDTITLDSLPGQIQILLEKNPDKRTSAAPAAADAEGESAMVSFSGGEPIAPLNGDASSDLNFPLLKEKFEKEFIIKALKAFDGRVNQTAEHTQMTKVTLLRKLEKYGIDPKQFHRHS